MFQGWHVGVFGSGEFEPVAVRSVYFVGGLVVFLGVGHAAGHDGADPGPVVGAVVGEGFAGPLAGDEDAAAGEAEGGALVDLPGAPSGRQAGLDAVGLDAVQQPVGAGR
ncbi:hypothetical protein SAMN05443287_106214 [Micromonospora phaseoli]|uniref:Uncharacterized protein n=1 Tax=Micromonospora phaseoli TaxID=1144548 RepID=A0A1H7APC6_9ACTN|nr:hypothetical protein CLV64_107175 [Micromonospora phaseoli]GIJ75974.1 hypothetical protein Xph01_04060 [Micromonospora phaseoli]SEJ66484.1 hypothetical protein SAMN05443287_106214 [Micromonospora phaseoli]